MKTNTNQDAKERLQNFQPLLHGHHNDSRKRTAAIMEGDTGSLTKSSSLKLQQYCAQDSNTSVGYEEIQQASSKFEKDQNGQILMLNDPVSTPALPQSSGSPNLLNITSSFSPFHTPSVNMLDPKCPAVVSVPRRVSSTTPKQHIHITTPSSISRQVPVTILPIQPDPEDLSHLQNNDRTLFPDSPFHRLPLIVDQFPPPRRHRAHNSSLNWNNIDQDFELERMRISSDTSEACEETQTIFNSNKKNGHFVLRPKCCKQEKTLQYSSIYSLSPEKPHQQHQTQKQQQENCQGMSQRGGFEGISNSAHSRQALCYTPPQVDNTSTEYENILPRKRSFVSIEKPSRKCGFGSSHHMSYSSTNTSQATAAAVIALSFTDRSHELNHQGKKKDIETTATESLLVKPSARALRHKFQSRDLAMKPHSRTRTLLPLCKYPLSSDSPLMLLQVSLDKDFSITTREDEASDVSSELSEDEEEEFILSVPSIRKRLEICK